MLSIKTMHKLVLNSNVYQLKQPIQKDRYTVLFEKELEKSPSLTVISDGLLKNKNHIDYSMCTIRRWTRWYGLKRSTTRIIPLLEILL